MKGPKITLLLVLFSSYIAHAQLLSTTPTIPKETSTVNIVVDVSMGNKGLLNYANTNDVYVHIGAITGSDGSDWKGVPFTWGSTTPAAKATYEGNNKYSFTVNNIRDFFNIPAGTPILKIAILFRNGAGTVVQRNADGSDMFVEVFGNELSGKFLKPFFQPKFIPEPEPDFVQVGEQAEFMYVASKLGSLSFILNGVEVENELSSNIITHTATISTPGNNRMIVNASAEGENFSDTLDFYVAPATEIAPVPAGMRQGINYETDTSVVLVLYAPEKSRVMVLGDFNDWKETAGYQMKKDPDGKHFWLTIGALSAGTEYGYQYKIDELTIADPYAELILDPNNDQYISNATYPGLKAYPTGKTNGMVGVFHTAKPAFNWQHSLERPDKRNLIIYELLLRDFLAAADWKTLKDTLSYLNRLGVNAIELLPFNEFEGNISWGYNPSFYFAPDKYYGPAEQLKQFIDECHRLGIAVIMDIALNHQFGQSPMVQMYWDAANNRPSTESPWFNPVPKHGFNVGYDMNHESEATKYFTGRVIEYWLQEFKIDGFRFDLSKGFTQKQTCDANGGNCNIDEWGKLDEGRVAIWKAYYDSVQAKSTGAYVILEHLGHNEEEKILSDYGMLLWGNMNHNFTEAAMGYNANSDLSWGLYTSRSWENPHLITYAESHDEERMVYKNLQFGNASGSYSTKELNTALKRSEQAAAFLFAMPGPKMFWQFAELGYDFSINYCENGSISDNCRTNPKPVRWDYQSHSGRKRLFEVYAGLIKLRKHGSYAQAFMQGNVQAQLTGALKWIKLSTDTSSLVVVGNFDVVEGNINVSFPQAGTWYEYFSGTTFNASGSQQTISLQPGEYKLFLNRNITNVLTPVTEIEYREANTHLKVYPNPVTPSSTIEFEIPESGMVNISLVNIYGQTAGNNITLMKMKGKHNLTLNMLTGNRTLATGTYMLCMEFEGVRKTRQVFINR